ncbi:aldehyde dehydrogenase family protein [Cryobacterium ruanii]|uniref:aldehyde dehydrogenase family protein n=1 Tax=Cryobacterium ruanii TaxID=1259197 RepID=UPI003BAF63EB
MANVVEFGLVGYVLSLDLNRALRLSEELEVGMLGVNTGIGSNQAAPFGAVKQFGLCQEGFDGIEEYLVTRYVGIADPLATAN